MKNKGIKKMTKLEDILSKRKVISKDVEVITQADTTPEPQQSKQSKQNIITKIFKTKPKAETETKTETKEAPQYSDEFLELKRKNDTLQKKINDLERKTKIAEQLARKSEKAEQEEKIQKALKKSVEIGFVSNMDDLEELRMRRALTLDYDKTVGALEHYEMEKTKKNNEIEIKKMPTTEAMAEKISNKILSNYY